MNQIAGRDDRGQPRHQQREPCSARDTLEIEQAGDQASRLRRTRSVATANPASSSNRPGAAEVVSSKSPASIDHANHALRRFWPINCQECNNNSAQSGRASTEGPNSTPGQLKAATVIVSKT